MVNRKHILTGYRAEGIKLYRTDLKFCGRLVAGVGFVLVGFGVITLPLPTGSVFAIGLGSALLGLVGIKLNLKKKIANKIRLFKYKRGLI